MSCEREDCKKLQEEKTALTARVTALEGEKNNLQTQKTASDTNATKLQAELNKQKTDFNNLQTQKKASDDKAAHLEKEKKASADKVAQLEKEKTEIQAKVQVADNKVVQLEGDMAKQKDEMDKKIQEIQAETNALKKSKEELEGNAKRLEEENKSLKDQKKASDDKVAQLEKEKKTLSDKITQLGKEKTEIQVKFQAGDNKVVQLEDDMKKQKAEMEKIIQELQAETNALTKSKEDFEGDTKRLEEENKNFKDQKNASDERVTQMQVQLEELQKSINQLGTDKNNLEEQKRGLEARITDLEAETNAKEAQLQTEKQVSDEQRLAFEMSLKEMEDSLQAQKDILTGQIAQLQREMGELMDQKRASEDKANEMQLNLQDEINKQKDILEQLQNEIYNLKANLNEYNASYEELQLQKNETDLKATNLEQELLKINNKFNISPDKQIYQYKITPKASQPFFDCSVTIESLFCLTSNEKCWPIEFKNWDEYQEKSQQESSGPIVGIMGNDKTGKRFLLSKLTGDDDFPQGRSDRKKGINVLYPNEKSSWTILEASGGNTLIKMEDIKNEVEGYMDEKKILKEEIMDVLVEDSKIMESLAQEFVAQNCQVLIVSVGRLRREDQVLLSRVKKLGAKKLLVIHNYLDIQNREDVKTLIDVDIRRNSNTKPRMSGEEPFLYLENDNGVVIYHFVMAHEGSEAGQFYNEKTIEFVKQVILTNDSFPDQFDFIVAFEKYLKINLKRYVRSNATPKDIIIREEDEGESQQNRPRGFRLGGSGQYVPKIKRENNNDEDIPSIPFTLRKVSRDDDVINRDGKVGPKEFIEMELETIGTCDLNSLVFEVVDVNSNKGEQQKQIVVQGKIERTSKEGEVLDNTRRLGNFKVVTKPFKLDEGQIVNIAEAPELRQNSGPESYGLTILSWGLGTKVTTYKQ